MKTELIIIGSELLNGSIQDRQTQWFSQFLAKKGRKINYCSFVADEPEDLLDAFKLAKRRSHLIVISGGLGPTKDDITEQYFKEAFASTNANVHEVSNPIGSACGHLAEFDDKLALALPGVPREFQVMITESVEAKYFEPFFLRHQLLPQELLRIRTKLIPESKIFTQLCPGLWETLESYGAVASLPQIMGVDITVTLVGSKEQREEKKKQICDIIMNGPLAQHVWTLDNEAPASELLRRLRKCGQTLALAESCTGGLISHLLTEVSGCSDVYLGSIVSYSNLLKQSILGVSPISLEEDGAVSGKVVAEMASGVQKLTRADYVIATSGIAGPNGGTTDKPVGTIWYCLLGRNGNSIKQAQLKGDRFLLKQRFAHLTLFELMDFIES